MGLTGGVWAAEKYGYLGNVLGLPPKASKVYLVVVLPRFGMLFYHCAARFIFSFTQLRNQRSFCAERASLCYLQDGVATNLDYKAIREDIASLLDAEDYDDGTPCCSLFKRCVILQLTACCFSIQVVCLLDRLIWSSLGATCLAFFRNIQ